MSRCSALGPKWASDGTGVNLRRGNLEEAKVASVGDVICEPRAGGCRDAVFFDKRRPKGRALTLIRG